MNAEVLTNEIIKTVGTTDEKEKEKIAKVIAEGQVNDIANRVERGNAQGVLRFAVTGEKPSPMYFLFGDRINIDQKYALETALLRQEGLLECTDARLSTCIANDLGRRVYAIIKKREEARRKELREKQKETQKQNSAMKENVTSIDSIEAVEEKKDAAPKTLQEELQEDNK